MDFALTRPLEVVEVDVVLPVAGMLGLALARRTIPRGTWGACAVCAPVVARRDPDHLAHHVLAQWVASGRLATPADLTSLSSLYRLLLPALGPPTPSPPTEVW
jgi:hypothetical protein